jgi:hypothetical protein
MVERYPYIEQGREPTLRRSVLAFMDILGYSDLIRAPERVCKQEVTLRAIHAALRRGRGWLEDRGLSPILRDMSAKDFYALKAFTDNVVIGWPVRDDAESEFGSAFVKLGNFQFQMILAGFFVRGALAVGDAYVDETVVFGSALIEAYDGESTLARDPRIILTTSAVAAARQHLRYYGRPDLAPHVRDVLRDSDGQWFINYLECVLWAEQEQGPFYEEFLLHKAVVESKLRDHSGNPGIWAKYAWVAGYHNFFCDLHPHYFGDEHRIDLNLFRRSPGLITDAAPDE